MFGSFGDMAATCPFCNLFHYNNLQIAVDFARKEHHLHFSIAFSN